MCGRIYKGADDPHALPLHIASIASFYLRKPWGSCTIDHFAGPRTQQTAAHVTNHLTLQRRIYAGQTACMFRHARLLQVP